MQLIFTSINAQRNTLQPQQSSNLWISQLEYKKLSHMTDLHSRFTKKLTF